MFIQNGGSAPLAVTFEGRHAVTGESKNTLLTAPPRPEAPAKPETRYDRSSRRSPKRRRRKR